MKKVLVRFNNVSNQLSLLKHELYLKTVLLEKQWLIVQVVAAIGNPFPLSPRKRTAKWTLKRVHLLILYSTKKTIFISKLLQELYVHKASS